MAKNKDTRKSKRVPLKKNGSPDLRYSKAKANKKKPTTYQILSKQFTKLNKELPEEYKLSRKERSKILKEQVLPQFAGIPRYKLRVKAIRAVLEEVVEQIPHKEGCDINLLDISDYAYVEWFALDETIRELVPDCIYIKVSGGEYGETRIFNTRDYEYGSSGVREIVESIRQYADNVPSGRFIFSAYKKLRPNKRNDGTPENYYLDFILTYIDKNGNEEAYAETEQVEYELPKTKEVKKAKKRVKEVIEEKIKNLKTKKDSRRRAKRTIIKNVNQTIGLFKAADKTKNKTRKKILTAKGVQMFLKSNDQLKDYKKTGKITDYLYNKLTGRLEKSLDNDE